MADDGIEAALIKEANPFIDDLAEAVVHALRRDKRTNLPYVQTYPELGLANSTTRQTLPAEITWLLLYSAANAAPDLTLDIQGIVIPVTSFPAQIQLPLWGATVTLTNNDSANNVTVVATDRPILPQVAAAGGSTASPLYAELTGSLAALRNQKIDLVGSYDIATLTLTEGSVAVAAGATYNAASQNLLGYRTAAPGAIVSGTSLSWTLSGAQTIPDYGSFEAQTTSTLTGSFGASSAQTPLWGIMNANLHNTSGTNSLTILYLTWAVD